MRRLLLPFFALLPALFSALAARAQTQAPDPLSWPPLTADSLPGTRWWWMGDAVNADEITREMQAFHDAGLGTVEITPIYGVKGHENQSLPYLGPQWMEMLKTAAVAAQKLGMDVDMTTGTGWCMGGPTVSDQDANALAVYKDGTITQKPSGQKVKRPAPGGEGWMLNLLYPDAMPRYLRHFTDAFAAYDGPPIHGFFHDSYEYRGDWSPDFLAQFERRRGYKLQDHLPALFASRGDPDLVARVKYDYRETVSELIAESIARWTQWAHAHGFVTREQAHGSPGNWIDIYAAADIPETEFDFNHPDILVSKFASSAAHLSGKNMTSSETGTWAAEHFTETLARLKSLCDGFFLSGVNRVMWQGTTYSLADAPWPGWCFYASTEMNPRNALWHDAPALHAYLARVQSFLQSGRPDNDVLLYWPVSDLWHNAKSPKKDLVGIMGVDGAWFTSQPVGKTAAILRSRGYAFDYVSDKFLQAAQTRSGVIALGDGRYRAIVVPDCAYMPLATLQKLDALAAAGATVIFENRVPADVPGLADLDARRAAFAKIAATFSVTPDDQLDASLVRAGVRREQALAAHEGIEFVRRALGDGEVYFIANRGATPLDDLVQLAAPAPHAAILDPMTRRSGLAETAGGVRLQLAPGQTLLVRTFAAAPPAAAARWDYFRPAGQPVALAGDWNVRFLEGGPELPAPFTAARLASWTDLGDAKASAFAGTALYTLRFDAPAAASARRWVIDLGAVVQSARVRLNGRDLGTVFAPPYRVEASTLKPRDNILEIEVTGTSANSIRDLDVRGVKWKIFTDANVLNIHYKPFDASKWPVAPQGLLGPVTLQPSAE